MAKAPKASSRKAKAPVKPTKGRSPEPIEDAVVVEETPPEPPKEEAPAVAVEPADTPAREVEAAENPPDDKPDAPAEEHVEPEPKTAPKPPAAPKAKRGGGMAAFGGFLLGGLAAAAIGFIAARYVVPDGWPFPGVAPEEDPVALAVEAQAGEISTLGEKIDALSASVSTLEGDTRVEALQTGLDALDGAVDEMTNRLAEMEDRLAAVERLAPEGSAAAQMAAEAYARELATLREMFEGELAKVEAAQTGAAELEAQAAEAAKAAAGRAALARVAAALETGHPFADALNELSDSTGLSAPAGLVDVADKGVPTLAALQDAFPVAARAALDASIRAAVESGEMGRFAAFMRTQLGTRSLEPKEGSDADAVLSRAEAALKQGHLGAALAELDAMPEASQPAMADWRAMAETRKAALDAGAALAQELNAK